MTRRLVATSLVLACLAVPALAARPGAAGPSGPAAGAVGAYLRDTRIDCYTQAGEGRCQLAKVASGNRVFYGTLEGAPAAVAFVDYQYDATGNAMDMMAVVFREEGGAWKPVGRAEGIQGSQPREVRFEGTAITYTGTMLGDGDARSNPTARGRFRLLVEGGKVTFARTKGGR